MYRSRLVALIFVAVTAFGASSLGAQEVSPRTPRLEAGLDVAIAGPDGSFNDPARLVLVPRLTVNMSPRTALTVLTDVFAHRRYIGESWADGHVVTAELRRGLVQTDRFRMSGLVGGGYGWTRFFQPEYSYLIRGEPVIVPASTHTTTGPEFTLGLSAEQRMASRLALRQEVRVVLGEVSEFRAQLGVSVPLGRFPARFDPPLTRTGRRPDSLRNGTAIGAIVGSAAMTGFVAFIASALCEGECDNLGPALVAGAGYGAGAGALAGAMIDSFRE